MGEMHYARQRRGASEAACGSRAMAFTKETGVVTCKRCMKNLDFVQADLKRRVGNLNDGARIDLTDAYSGVGVATHNLRLAKERRDRVVKRYLEMGDTFWVAEALREAGIIPYRGD